MTGVAWLVKGVAGGGGVSPDELSCCQIGGVNLPSMAPVPIQNVLLSSKNKLLDIMCPHTHYANWQLCDGVK